MNRILSHKVAFVVIAVTVLSLCVLVSTALIKNFSPIIYVAQQKEADLVPVIQKNQASTTDPILFSYIEVLDSCDPYYQGLCVNMRSGPGKEYPTLARLRTGIVLKVAETVTKNGMDWYKIQVDKTIPHPERVTGDWFVASGDYIRLFTDVGDQLLSKKYNLTTKRIIVNISKEMLYAYDGNNLFMQEPISTGLEFTPTPSGTFTVYKKTPSRYMQGPELEGASDQYYDLPGVPWDLYFTPEGDVIHGTYWHDHFGERWSHGCVNLPTQKAKELYYWADIGTPVIVRN